MILTSNIKGLQYVKYKIHKFMQKKTNKQTNKQEENALPNKQKAN